MTVWTRNELDSIEVVQNKTDRIVLGAKLEALTGDMGWSTFRERIAKAGPRYRARLQRMDENKLARNIYEWNMYGKRMKDSVKVEV